MEEEKKLPKKKKVVIGILCAILVPIAMVGIVKVNFNQAANIGFNTFIAYWASKVPGMEVYELTEAEKKWLKAKFGDEERIEKGRLYESEGRQLKRAREGLSVLEEKYPGYHFRITWLVRYDTWTSFTVYEETTGEKVVMNVKEDEESGYEVTDNFYGYLFKDKYEAYLRELFDERGVENILIWVGLSTLAGREYDINMTVEDVVNGKLELWPSVHIDVYVGDMSEEECMKYSQTLQDIIEDINLDGAYLIDFMNMTKEEMLSTGEYGKTIFENNFQLHRRKEGE